jgi:two-component system sensor histidine kinase YesM
MRMHRIEYEIAVPDSMMEEIVPRLIIQPLVENAIVHGIERRTDGGRITITGEQDETYNRIVVQDNGTGLTAKELHRLLAGLREPMTDRIGRGTWNVHQRLYYQFGEGSGLTFGEVPEGGLKAVLTWNRKRNAKDSAVLGAKGAESDRSAVDRR